MADSQPYHSHNDAAVRDDDDAADGGGAGGIVDHDSIHIHSLHAERDPSNPSAESLSPGSHEGWLTKRGWKLGCVPVWKRRWFILKGQYIFKFESPTVRVGQGTAESACRERMRVKSHGRLTVLLSPLLVCRSRLVRRASQSPF